MRVREVHVRYTTTSARFDGRKSLRHPDAVVELVRELTPSDNREHVSVLYLCTRHRLLAYQTVHIGTASQALISPREVFQPAVLLGAHAIVVLHNHPSGDPTPSADDREVTKRLREVGEILGIRLLDHIVWSRESVYYSFAQSGELPTLKDQPQTTGERS